MTSRSFVNPLSTFPIGPRSGPSTWTIVFSSRISSWSCLVHTVHYNITVEEYISALMLVASTALFIWAHKRTGRLERLSPFVTAPSPFSP